MTESVKHETVLDTGALQLGRVYAQALISAAEKEQATDQVLGELGTIVDDVLVEHSNLSTVFGSPRVDQAEKCKILDRLFGDKIHSTLLRFLKVASSRGRLGYLREIHHAATALRDEMLDRVVAEVRTAQPLSDELRRTVEEQISRSIGMSVALREVVDPSLIGGLVVRYGDTVIDSSVASKLNALSNSARDGFERRLMESADAFAKQ